MAIICYAIIPHMLPSMLFDWFPLVVKWLFYLSFSIKPPYPQEQKQVLPQQRFQHWYYPRSNISSKKNWYCINSSTRWWPKPVVFLLIFYDFICETFLLLVALSEFFFFFNPNRETLNSLESEIEVY